MGVVPLSSGRFLRWTTHQNGVTLLDRVRYSLLFLATCKKTEVYSANHTSVQKADMHQKSVIRNGKLQSRNLMSLIRQGMVLQSKTVFNIILTLYFFLASVQHMQCTVTYRRDEEERK